MHVFFRLNTYEVDPPAFGECMSPMMGGTRPLFMRVCALLLKLALTGEEKHHLNRGTSAIPFFGVSYENMSTPFIPLIIKTITLPLILL